MVSKDLLSNAYEALQDEGATNIRVSFNNGTLDIHAEHCSDCAFGALVSELADYLEKGEAYAE